MSWLRRTPSAPPADWRKLASPEDLREYDAFGPWIDPVRSLEQMPRAFRDFYPELAGAEVLLKVPRDVERVQARPGQNLYRAVLAVHDHGITQLRLAADGVARLDASWQQIVGLSTYQNLLQARWTALLADGDRIDLEYNSVGMQTIAGVTSLLRSQFETDAPEDSATSTAPAEVKDFFLSNQIAQLRRTSDGPVLALQEDPKNRLCRAPDGRRGLSTGLMLASTRQELVIVNRGEPTRRFFLPNYASTTTYLPYARLSSFALEDPVRHSSFTTLVLRAGDQVVRQQCLGRPDAAREFLLARGIPES